MSTRLALFMVGSLLALSLSACYRPAPPTATSLTPARPTAPSAPPPAAPPASVLVDGSAQVASLTTSIAARFQQWQPAYRVEVGTAGTSAGFDRLCRGEIDLVNAIRPMDTRAMSACAQHGVRWLEIVVAYDALAVIANPTDTFLTCLTLDELRTVWREGGAQSWSAVRASFPDLPLTPVFTELSPTLEQFLADRLGGAMRTDATPAGEDPPLVVAQTAGAVGLLEYARYGPQGAATHGVRFVEIDAGAGCTPPAPEMIWRGLYDALARPLYLYVNSASLQRLPVSMFLGYALSADGQATIAEAGYLPAAPEQYARALAIIAAGGAE